MRKYLKNSTPIKYDVSFLQLSLKQNKVAFCLLIQQKSSNKTKSCAFNTKLLSTIAACNRCEEAIDII